LRKREAAVLATCEQQILSRPLSEVTMKSVIEASGLPVWAAHGAVHRLARNRDHLLRRAFLQVCNRLAGQLSEAPPEAPSILATIEAEVARMAALVKDEEFRSLFRLVVCDGRSRQWLHQLYEEKVASAFCTRLEEAVERSGRQSAVAVFFRPGAARNILRRLETAFALPGLLPGELPGGEDEQALIRRIAQEAFAGTYAWDVGEAA
jgi:hypothetical protein